MRAVAQRRRRVAGYVPGDNARRLFEVLARVDPLLRTRLGIAHVEWAVLALLTLHSHILIVADFPPARQGFTQGDLLKKPRVGVAVVLSPLFLPRFPG